MKICRIKSSRLNTISYHVVNIYITYIIIEPEACLVNRGTKMLYKNVVDTQLLAQKKWFIWTPPRPVIAVETELSRMIVTCRKDWPLLLAMLHPRSVYVFSVQPDVVGLSPLCSNASLLATCLAHAPHQYSPVAFFAHSYRRPSLKYISGVFLEHF